MQFIDPQDQPQVCLEYRARLVVHACPVQARQLALPLHRKLPTSLDHRLPPCWRIIAIAGRSMTEELCCLA
jgi:hypothetical protein